MNMLRASCVALLLIAAACGRKSPEEQLVKSVDAAASWIPTLQMVAGKWIANAVPKTFARSAAEAASKEFKKARKQIDQSKAAGELRERLRRDLNQGSEFADALKRAAESDEPQTIAPAAAGLSAVQDDLQAVKQQYGGSS